VRPDVAVPVPHGIVNVIVETAAIVRIDAHLFAVAHVGVELVGFSALEVYELSEVQYILCGVVLTHRYDLVPEILMDLRYLMALSDTVYIETAFVAQQHVVGLTRELDVGDQQVPRHVVPAGLGVPFRMAVNHETADSYLPLVVIPGVLVNLQDGNRLNHGLSCGCC
jgi:hypothetical protein